MLKNFLTNNIGNKAKEKCGEIFCHSSTDFTIFCTFCNMKAFTFEDFQLHVKNVHFENNLLKVMDFNTDCDRYYTVNIKNEVSAADKQKEDVPWDNLQHSTDDDAGDTDDGEEEFITVLPKSKRNIRIKTMKATKQKSDSESNNEQSSDEDYKPMLNDKISAGPEDKPHHCEQCDKSFINLGLLKIHLIQKHDEKPKEKVLKNVKDVKEFNICPECNQIFNDKKSMDDHVADVHDGYQCPFCKKRFKKRRYLKRHELYHTTGRIFECNFEGCGRNYVVKRDLERHMDTHTTERNFICNFENCGKAFHTARRLQQHGLLHIQTKDLVCDTCGYSCRNIQMLKLHQRIHTGEKPFGCEICDKRFISSSALGEHMASHSNSRPHVCKVCNASFGRQKSLYHHSFIHSDFKKFKCKLCGTAYKQSAGLAGHMRKHREEGMVTTSPDQANSDLNTSLNFLSQL